MVTLWQKTHHHHRVREVRPIMTGATKAHHQQVDAISGPHITRLSTQRRLSRNGRAKGQHLLRCNEGKAANDTQQQQDNQAGYQTPPATASREWLLGYRASGPGRLSWLAVRILWSIGVDDRSRRPTRTPTRTPGGWHLLAWRYKLPVRIYGWSIYILLPWILISSTVRPLLRLMVLKASKD